MLVFNKADVNQGDICQMFNALLIYSNSGVSIVDSLQYYNKHCRQESVNRLIDDLITSIHNGKRFSDALRKHIIFKKFIVELIAVGEQSGQINEVLKEIVFYLEQEIDLKRDIKSSLFPVKFFLAGLFIAISIAIFLVIPKMGEILHDLHADLPLITKIVVGICNGIVNFWFLELIAIAISFCIYKFIKQNHPEKIDKIILKIPFYGDFYYAILQYRLTKILALTLNAGIAIQNGIKYTASAVDHIPLRNILLNSSRHMLNGVSPADAMERANKEGNLIAEDIFMMMKVGQESGNLGKILNTIAVDNRKKIVDKGKNIGSKIGSSIIIPGMVLIMVVMASVYAPLLSMAYNATNM